MFSRYHPTHLLRNSLQSHCAHPSAAQPVFTDMHIHPSYPNPLHRPPPPLPTSTRNSSPKQALETPPTRSTRPRMKKGNAQMIRQPADVHRVSCKGLAPEGDPSARRSRSRCHDSRAQARDRGLLAFQPLPRCLGCEGIMFSDERGWSGQVRKERGKFEKRGGFGVGVRCWLTTCGDGAAAGDGEERPEDP